MLGETYQVNQITSEIRTQCICFLIQTDLKEGFELTSRLFFNTLEKYNIKQFNPTLKAKFNKD